MTPPKDAELFETPISTHWMEDGIMCAISKPLERKAEHYEKVFEVYKKIIGDSPNKLCLLAVSDNSTTIPKEVREFLVREMPKYVKAHAIISDQPFENGKLKTFMNLSFSGFPVAVFPNKEEALQWLKEHL